MNPDELPAARTLSARSSRSLSNGRRPQYLALALGSAALLLTCAAAVPGGAPDNGHQAVAAGNPLSTPAVQSFLRRNCLACHDKANARGDLNLAAATFQVNDAKSFALWAKVHDRVADGEMPPKGANPPAAADKKAFLAAIGQPLAAADDSRGRREGRAIWRRMNRYEYENTLRDLLGAPWLQIKDMLPEDGLSSRFNPALIR